MIETAALLIAFASVVVVAFAGSIRVGILVGRRLDHFIEDRASAGDKEARDG